MVAVASEIIGPGAAAFVAGGLYHVVAYGLRRSAPTTPKVALIVPVFGIGSSLAGLIGRSAWSPMAAAGYSASFATLGWLGAELFYKPGT